MPANLYKLTLDVSLLSLARHIDKVFIKNLYVDIDDTHIITAPLDYSANIVAGLDRVVVLPATTFGSIYQIQFYGFDGMVLSAFFGMPDRDCLLSELDMHTAYPPKVFYPNAKIDWGRITGDITNQTDLTEVMFTKTAAGELADELDGLIKWGNIKGSMLDQEDLNEVMFTKSDAGELATELDGLIKWGNIKGLINDQTDLTEVMFTKTAAGELADELDGLIAWGNIKGSILDQTDLTEVMFTKTEAQQLEEDLLSNNSVVYNSLSTETAKLTSIRNDTNSIKTQKFLDINKGGATYQRSSLEEVEQYPPLAWFQTVDGAYWLLDEKYPTPEMFGAIPAKSMEELTHNGASDSTESIRQARQYALLKKRPLYIYGYFMWVGFLTLETNERILGKGRHNCGLQIKTDGALYEGGFQIINDNAFVVGLELQAYLYTPKLSGGGTGMVGVSLIIGNYSDGTIPVPKNYCLDDILLTRKDNETGHTSFNGIAMQVSGGANTGRIGLVQISGRHTVAYMSHWNGNATSPETPSTQTVHPRNFTIDKLIVSDHVDTLMTLSSVANLDIRSVYAKSCSNVLTVLAGDEADDFNVGEPNVGTGVHFGEIVVNNIDSKGKPFDEAMGITSLASSKFQTMFGQIRQQQLRIGITIDNLTMHTNDPAIIYGIDLFYYYGLFHVKSARLTGFKYPFRASKSRGDISINFEMTDGACIVKDSDAKLTGNFKLKDRFVTPYVNPWAVLVDSATFETPIYGFLRGDTVLTLPSPLPERIERGGVVEITGTINGKVQTVRYVSEKFVPRDATTIDLGVTFQNNCNSATLKYITKCDVDVDVEAMTGCYVGVFAKAGNVKVRGNLTAGRYNVHAHGANTVVDYKISSSVSGDYRLEGLTTSLYDLFLEAGATAIASGELGRGKLADTGIWRSIGGEASSGTRHKLIIKDAIIYDKTKVVAVEAHNIDCAVSGCITSTGKEYNIVDAYGLERIGSNANGHFERNANGVLECWARNVPVGSTQPHIWTFPQGFAATGSIYVDAISTSSSSSRVPSALATSGTQATITLTENAETTNGTASPSTAGMNLYAKGFWRLPS